MKNASLSVYFGSIIVYGEGEKWSTMIHLMPSVALIIITNRVRPGSPDSNIFCENLHLGMKCASLPLIPLNDACMTNMQ